MAPALKFAAAFAVVSFLVTAAQHAHATAGIYGVSALSGLIDAVPAAVSLAAQLKAATGLTAHVAAQGVGLAMIVNSLVKSFLAWSMGSRLAFKLITACMVFISVVGLVVAFTCT
jgi:uncharacterized membrane protein (DUF4010 family)